MISLMRLRRWSVLGIFVLLGATAGCSGSGDGETGARGGGETRASGDEKKASSGGERGGRPGAPGARSGGRGSGRPGSGRPGGPGGFGGGEASSRGVPIEVATVGRGSISRYFETHGTLEAENEVDLVARVSGPVVELLAEEGQQVEQGRLLARIDDRELLAQLDVARVRLEESEKSYERVKSLFDRELVSRDAYDQSFAAYGSAKGDFERLKVQLEHTRITAPFSGLIIQRYVKFAEHLQNGAQLFRLSDFDPLLCPIQVPERELARLRVGQRAELTVESYPESRFAAEVLRISPVVDAASGTVKVTLKVRGEGKLRPGMFSNVFLEMANRPDALVVPKTALALDSLGNTVFVVNEGVAERRDLELGFRNDELLEVLGGVEQGEQIVVVGQDGLSDGTPVEILASADGAPVPGPESEGAGPQAGPPSSTKGEPAARGPRRSQGAVEESGDRPNSRAARGARGPGGRPGFNIDWDDPEQVERVKDRMRERGLTDEQIAERLKRIRERMEQGGGRAGSGGDGRP